MGRVGRAAEDRAGLISRVSLERGGTRALKQAPAEASEAPPRTPIGSAPQENRSLRRGGSTCGLRS
jgi:hypothetical protein